MENHPPGSTEASDLAQPQQSPSTNPEPGILAQRTVAPGKIPPQPRSGTGSPASQGVAPQGSGTSPPQDAPSKLANQEPTPKRNSVGNRSTANIHVLQVDDSRSSNTNAQDASEQKVTPDSDGEVQGSCSVRADLGLNSDADTFSKASGSNFDRPLAPLRRNGTPPPGITLGPLGHSRHSFAPTLGISAEGTAKTKAVNAAEREQKRKRFHISPVVSSNDESLTASDAAIEDMVSLNFDERRNTELRAEGEEQTPWDYSTRSVEQIHGAADTPSISAQEKNQMHLVFDGPNPFVGTSHGPGDTLQDLLDAVLGIHGVSDTLHTVADGLRDVTRGLRDVSRDVPYGLRGKGQSSRGARGVFQGPEIYARSHWRQGPQNAARGQNGGHQYGRGFNQNSRDDWVPTSDNLRRL